MRGRVLKRGSGGKQLQNAIWSLDVSELEGTRVGEGMY